MDEQQQSARDRLREFFSGKIDIVTTDGEGITLTHHLRTPTSEEDINFRKRLSGIKFVGSRAEPADAVFVAPIQLYDQICESVTAEVDGENENIDDFKTKIPADLKVAIISAFQSRYRIGEARRVSGDKGN